MNIINKNRNIFIVVLVCISLLIILFFSFHKDKTVPSFKDSPIWTYNLILTFDGHEYDVTKQTTTDIGNEIGTIFYHGTFLVSSAGYTLYAINSVKTTDRIAVKTKQGFLIAKIKSYN